MSSEMKGGGGESRPNLPFSHTYNPVPCNPPLGPSEVHERGSSITLLGSLLLGYTKVFGAFSPQEAYVQANDP